MCEPKQVAEGPVVQRAEQEYQTILRNFADPRQEWRRLFSELYGTFLLVIVAAGGGMMSQAFPTRSAARQRSSHRA